MKSVGAGTRDDLRSELGELGREVFLQRLTSAARKAVAKLPEPHEVEKLSGDARIFVEQVSALVNEGLSAHGWSEARLARYVGEVAWGRLAAATAAVALRDNGGGGGGGKTCVGQCSDEYDRCMAESGCSYSWFCLCCTPCSLQYMGCVARCVGYSGGFGIFEA